MNWTFFVGWVIQTAATVVYVISIEHHVKVWGRCSYICGYIDGKSGKLPKPITEKELMKKVKEETKCKSDYTNTKLTD